MSHDRINPAVSELVREEIAARGWSVQKFAEHAQASRRLAEGIINGTGNFYRSTAWRLCWAFGTSEELWMNLQASEPKPESEDYPRRRG